MTITARELIDLLNEVPEDTQIIMTDLELNHTRNLALAEPALYSPDSHEVIDFDETMLTHSSFQPIVFLYAGAMVPLDDEH